jgi:hypothetical protein
MKWKVYRTNGSLLHKQQFLANTKKGPDVANYNLRQSER